MADRRYGEADDTLTEEQKMSERFRLEKLKRAKREAVDYNLEDDDEEEALTHFGKALHEVEDEDLPDVSNGSEDEGDMPEMKKRRSEMTMSGFIAQAKDRKAEKKQAKEEVTEETNQLDDELEELRGLLKVRPPGVKKETPSTAAVDDEYDKFIRIMTFDRRATATDRTETEIEVADKAKDKRDQMEAYRLARMSAAEQGHKEDRGMVDELGEAISDEVSYIESDEEVQEKGEDAWSSFDEDDRHEDAVAEKHKNTQDELEESDPRQLLTAKEILSSNAIDDIPDVIRSQISSLKALQFNRSSLERFTPIVLELILAAASQSASHLILDNLTQQASDLCLRFPIAATEYLRSYLISFAEKQSTDKPGISAIS